MRLRVAVRTRLALVYGGLLLVAGAVLLGLTYTLVSQRLFGEAGSTTTVTEPGASSGTRPLVTHEEVADETGREALWTLLTRGGIALAVVGAVAVLLSRFIAGRMLRPLHQVTGAARRIAEAPGRGLGGRIALDGPADEVKELADTFDLMLERLDHSFDGQRTFIANASHELRTPLAVNRALLEVAVLRGPASEEVRAIGRTLLAINERHERLIDGLLLLARADSAVANRSYVDLADLVDHVVSQAPPGKTEVTTSPEEAAVEGDPVLLNEIVRRLVDNALRHNLPDGGLVHVSTGTAEDGSAVLTVCNTGPPVPMYEMEGLFEPFRRLGGDRPGPAGAGLGLSIVRAIARGHGGDARAVPRDGGGLEVTVTLPGA